MSDKEAELNFSDLTTEALKRGEVQYYSKVAKSVELLWDVDKYAVSIRDRKEGDYCMYLFDSVVEARMTFLNAYRAFEGNKGILGKVKLDD